MASTSLTDQAREVGIQITSILSRHDLSELPQEQKQLVNSLSRDVVDARLDVRDYEYAETRAEQLHSAKEARMRLEHLQKTILKVSEQGIFGAVDVAQLSARIQQLIAQLT